MTKPCNTGYRNVVDEISKTSEPTFKSDLEEVITEL